MSGTQVNPRTRQSALYAIAAVAILASLNAMAHSYMGLAGWAGEHGQTGWWKWTWPLEIDVFLLAGELALYVAYLDGWPRRSKVWPWALALVGLAVSVAGNVGHVAPPPGRESALLADQLTAAAAPVAAFAGLWVGLLTLKESAKHAAATTAEREPAAVPAPVASGSPQSDPDPSGQSDSAAGEPDSLDDGAGLLAEAVRLDARHRAETGRPVSADRLRHELGVGSERARRLVREIRESTSPNGQHSSQYGQHGQLELAPTGGDP